MLSLGLERTRTDERKDEIDSGEANTGNTEITAITGSTSNIKTDARVPFAPLSRSFEPLRRTPRALRVQWRFSEQRFAVDAASIPWHTADRVFEIRQCYLKRESDARAVCIVARETYDRECGCTSWEILSHGQSDEEDMHVDELEEAQFNALYALRDKHPRVSATRGTFCFAGVPVDVTVVDMEDENSLASQFAFVKWYGYFAFAKTNFPSWVCADAPVHDARFSMRHWAH